MWVQAPPHVVENLRNDEKTAATGKKSMKKKPPERGYAHWSQDTFDKLVGGEPEALRSHFQVNHQMVMSLLDRPVMNAARVARVDGCAAVRRLMVDNHETRKRQRGHIRRAIAIYRSLVEADLLEFPDPPDEYGRRVRVNFDLQDEFALHQPLSLWALEAIGRLPERGEDLEGVHALDVLTIIEAIQESPGVIMAAQMEQAKSALMAEMKAAGVEYEERMERLSQVEPPKPNKDWMYGNFNEFRAKHPWVGGDTVRPKSIVRDLWERVMTFTEYVNHYGLKRSEGVLLRYLSDVYKGLRQNVRPRTLTDEIGDLVEWLGAVVRQVDSSLIDEWERLLDPTDEPTPTWPPSGSGPKGPGWAQRGRQRAGVPGDGAQPDLRLGAARGRTAGIRRVRFTGRRSTSSARRWPATTTNTTRSSSTPTRAARRASSTTGGHRPSRRSSTIPTTPTSGGSTPASMSTAPPRPGEPCSYSRTSDADLPQKAAFSVRFSTPGRRWCGCRNAGSAAPRQRRPRRRS